jgi:hypothetical protein
MARCGISFLGALLLVLIAQPATAQIGAFSQSPDREVGNNSRARGAGGMWPHRLPAASSRL